MRLSKPSLLHQLTENLLRIEIFVSQFARRVALGFVVIFNSVDSGENVVQGFKGEETSTSGQTVAEAGFLRNHRPARGKVTGAAIAKPATAQPDVLIFGHREFTSRLNDVI